eukprot:scaffold5517_cov228-Ochromonas_danica.AAC.2
MSIHHQCSVDEGHYVCRVPGRRAVKLLRSVALPRNVAPNLAAAAAALKERALSRKQYSWLCNEVV